MSESDMQTLSADGEKRRKAMLPALLNEMRRIQGRRRLRRRAAAMAALALLVTATVAVIIPNPGATTVDPPVVAGGSEEVTPEEIRPAAPQRVVVHARIVRTDPTAAERYLVRTQPDAALVIGDDELLETLEAIGRPTGLVRMNGRAWVTAAVTDDEIGESPAQRRNRPF